MPIYKGSFSVFPVYAGVILVVVLDVPDGSCVPRVCGGDPHSSRHLDGLFECSPCMRG